MILPKLKALQTSRDMIDAFGGYNHNLRIGAGEFYNMKNLTSSYYPVLSSRPNRGIYATPTTGNGALGLIAKDSLFYVEGDTLYENKKSLDLKLYTECNTCPNRATCVNFKEGSTKCEKTLISMGAYLIIMPDKKYINTADHNDCGNIEASVTTQGSTVSFEPCTIDGSQYTATKSNTEPTDPKSMDYWLDTSSKPHTLKQYSATSSMWVTVATTYIKISCNEAGTFDSFAVNDGVTISGVKEKLPDIDDKTTIIWAKGDNYIVITGILDESVFQETPVSQETPLTISRKMPNMDFIIESENRLWGCRYGPSASGEVVNEIYASKLGDFKNWNCFAGISTDSYAASVGTDGQFTGAITHLGYPLFFKENCIHKVYGNYPANYQIQTTPCRGVQKGCSKSLAIVNEVLYYKSRSAVCAYDGSLPVEVSSALGDIAYHDAVAGSLGNKYYISMADEAYVSHLFAYDTARGMWHREDNTRARAFCPCRGDLYYIDDSLGIIKSILGSENKENTAIEWMAETGIIGTDSPDRKYISRMDIRISMPVGTRVHIYIQYDSSGIWEHLHSMVATSLRTFAVPVRPKRCDHLRLRIEGFGEAKIFSISKTISEGSDI